MDRNLHTICILDWDAWSFWLARSNEVTMYEEIHEDSGYNK